MRPIVPIVLIVPTPARENSEAMPTENSPSNHNLIAIWPADAQDIDEIARQLGHFGHTFKVCSSIEELLEINASGQVAGNLLGCDAATRLTEAHKAELLNIAQRAPIAALSNDSSIHQRLAAVRMGCNAFFTHPLDMTSLLDTLDRITSPQRASSGRVLIVDDSPSTAAFYAATLRSAGFLCDVITDPLKAMEALVEQPPELLLLDMHMPGATGEELAKVIRLQDAYLSIPIVFLSAESDVSRQREAMSMGGDEFLQKPIQPEHLVSAVRSRVIRYRALRALMVRDSLTGLLNHTSFKERLRTEVSRAQRQIKPLSVALIDIDFFKKVNDNYGHPVGDRVIKSLARLLKQRLRGADIIGRYGGEEFAVALPDTTLDVALKVVDSIRASFEAIVQHAGDATFQATLSAGVSAFPPTADSETLIKLADEALYVAKRAGRNQVQKSGAESATQ